MNYEFRTLRLDYELLSDYCTKLRKKIVESGREPQEGEGYDLAVTKYNFMWAERNPEFAIGAYQGEELVGTIVAIIRDTVFNDPKKEVKGLKLKSAFLCNLSIKAELWPGIELKNNLLATLINKLKDNGTSETENFKTKKE